MKHFTRNNWQGSSLVYCYYIKKSLWIYPEQVSSHRNYHSNRLAFFFSPLLFSRSTFFILHESSSFSNACDLFASFFSLFLLPVPNPVDRACVLRSCLSWSHTSPEKETLQTIPLAGVGFFKIRFVYYVCLDPGTQDPTLNFLFACFDLGRQDKNIFYFIFCEF